MSNDDIELFRVMIEKLPYRSREILKMRYGIDNKFSFTTKEIAYIYGVSMSRVRYVELLAIRQLRRLCRIHKTIKELIHEKDK